MSKHTPGPWSNYYKMNSSVQYETYNDLFMIADLEYSGRPDDETAANAQLISAAPDLLEACKAFVVAHKKSLQLEKTDCALRLAKAAIAAAEGSTK